MSTSFSRAMSTPSGMMVTWAELLVPSVSTWSAETRLVELVMVRPTVPRSTLTVILRVSVPSGAREGRVQRPVRLS